MIALNRPHRVFRRLALCLLFAFHLGVAHAKPDSLATLESAIRKEPAKTKPGGSENRERSRTPGLILVMQLREAVDRDDSRQVEAALSEITTLFESETVRAAVNKVRREFRLEHAAKEKEIVAKVRSVLTGASRAVKTARNAADLDAAIHDLRNMTDHQASASPEIRNELQKAQNARQFVLLWQDYLAAEAAGNMERAVRALQNASSVTTDLMERSQILARVEEASKRKNPDPNEPARQIMAKVKTLEDIPGALDALATLEPKPGSSAVDHRELVESLRRELSRVSQVYREYQAGLPITFQIKAFDAPQANEETFRTVLPLKVQLLRTILPRALEVDQNLQPSPEEPIRGYLDRVTAFAFEKGDLRLFVRARDFRNKVDGIPSSSASASVSQSLVAGLNQEEAGQWAAAVVSYEIALKFGADVIPAKHVGERLERIKAAHPREFEQGFQRFMSGFQPVPQNPMADTGDTIVVPEPAPASISSPSQSPQ